MRNQIDVIRLVIILIFGFERSALEFCQCHNGLTIYILSLLSRIFLSNAKSINLEIKSV